MKRQIIKIDEQKCNGCALCVSACHEGAIGVVNGKAKLLREDYCDGLGNCLPVCPAGAISFEEREAKPFDAETVKQRMKRLMNSYEEVPGKISNALKSGGELSDKGGFFSGCPGTAAGMMKSSFSEKKEPKLSCGCPGTASKRIIENNAGDKTEKGGKDRKENETPSQLRQWPVQIKLAPVNAPYFDNAHLLAAADCSAFACGDFHNKYMKGKITLAGCPKLDNADYAQKLSAIIKLNDIKSVTVIRMEVPCCAGLANAALEAVKHSGKNIKTQVVTLSLNGKEI